MPHPRTHPSSYPERMPPLLGNPAPLSANLYHDRENEKPLTRILATRLGHAKDIKPLLAILWVRMAAQVHSLLLFVNRLQVESSHDCNLSAG